VVYLLEQAHDIFARTRDVVMVVVLEGSHDTDLVGIVGGALETKDAAFPDRLTILPAADGAGEKPDYRRPKKLGDIQSLPDVLLDSILFIRRPPEIVVDSNTSNRQTTFQASFLDLFEMVALQRAERPEIEVHPVQS
jgi:hypothetical protein